MKNQKINEIDEYFKPTKLCDCDNVKLKEKAKEITKSAETPEDATLKIFYFVRDEMPFGFGLYDPEKKKHHTCLEGRTETVAVRPIFKLLYYEQQEYRQDTTMSVQRKIF